MRGLGNTREDYGVVAMLLHWVMAALLVALVATGLYMVGLPDAGFDTRKVALILNHKQLGMLALALAALRLGWRLGGPLPALVATLPEWQQVAARFVHLCFYALMFALPLTGWLMSSAAGFPVSFLGLFDLPDLVPRSEYGFRVHAAIHRWLGYALIAFFCAHAGAALRHHFLDKDDTLRRILPPARS